jgi:hypothetical protein
MQSQQRWMQGAKAADGPALNKRSGPVGFDSQDRAREGFPVATRRKQQLAQLRTILTVIESQGLALADKFGRGASNWGTVD